jgi:hypothetical protein
VGDGDGATTHVEAPATPRQHENAPSLRKCGVTDEALQLTGLLALLSRSGFPSARSCVNAASPVKLPVAIDMMSLE